VHPSDALQRASEGVSFSPAFLVAAMAVLLVEHRVAEQAVGIAPVGVVLEVQAEVGVEVDVKAVPRLA